MRIVLVHGRAAQMEIPALMESDMTAALAFGQARIEDGLDPGSLDVHLAFYGDIWRPDLRQPLPVIEPVEEAEEAFPGVSDISLWVDEHLGVGDFLTEHMLKDVRTTRRPPATPISRRATRTPPPTARACRTSRRGAAPSQRRTRLRRTTPSTT
jgi:hypothetical protein